MAGKDEFFLNPSQPQAKLKDEDMHMEAFAKSWGERIAFTTGFGFLSGSFLGATVGVTLGLQRAKRSRYAKAQHIFARGVLLAMRGGNAVASASLLFILVGKGIELAFEEEIQDYGNDFRNFVAGGVAGSIYKCSLGRRPMVVGCLMGIILAMGTAHTINSAYLAGRISFKANI